MVPGVHKNWAQRLWMLWCTFVSTMSTISVWMH